MTLICLKGSPPAWQPPVDKPALQEDSGKYFRDVNGAHFPNYPIEPAVRALCFLKPQFDGSTVDIVGCGNTLGTLLSFARFEERTFRFGIEKVGKTLFMVRRENSPHQLIEGVYGYGHTFPEAYTAWDANVRGSASHQRLISYDFGGLRLLIRSESDGYLPKMLPSSEPSSQKSVLEDIDISSLDLLILSAKSIVGSENLAVTISGQPIPQAAIFDLKTRSAGREFNMDEILPRLWVNQTPNFIIAYHNRGRFDDIQIKDIRQEVKAWEEGSQDILRRFHAVLHELIKILDSQEIPKIEVRRTGKGSLEVWTEVETWEALPVKLRQRWTDGEANDQNGKGAGAGAIDYNSEEEDSDDGEGNDDYLDF
jgi:hypothetical protein